MKKILTVLVIALIILFVIWVLYNIFNIISSELSLNKIKFKGPQFNQLNPVASLVVDEPPKINKDDLGELSPLYGKIKILKDLSYLGDKASSAKYEYLYLQANPNNKDSINISGMLLQSLVTNKIAIIPQGVDPYVLGQINTVQDIYLKPGEAAIVITGKSPINFSFKTNACSGYLNRFKEFYPKLPESWCPKPTEIMPNTVENIKKYGDLCIEAAKKLKPCEYFTSDNPYYSRVSKECREKLAVELTYNRCLKKLIGTDELYPPSSVWMIYLGREAKLWKDKYEAIKLMDKESRTIDAISY